MYLHKSDKLALIRILSGGHPLSAASPALTLLNVFVRCRGGWARVEQNARAGRTARQKVRGRESPRNDRFEVNEEGRDSEGWANRVRM